MRPDDFAGSTLGELRMIKGHDAYLGRDFEHVAYIPRDLPSSVGLEERTYQRISKASLAIGRLDFAVRRLPNPALLVRPALRKEAQSTSALEGTFATLEEILEADYIDESSRRMEVREVLNYVRAAEQALDLIEHMPICLRLIAQLQGILVRGTRGEAQDSGRLRESQVYIGEPHLGIEASRFVPPPPGDALRDGISAWEKWINAEDDIPSVAKAAIGHYQFETLHPFSDGNGRLGRLIVTLQFIAAGDLTYPILNLSPWLEERKDEYKDHLLAVSRTGDFNGWVTFFSDAVIAQATDGIERIEALLDFREDLQQRLHRDKARGVVLQIADSLLGYPMISPSQAASLHRVTYPPANAAIAKLVDLGVLQEITGGSYGRIFVCRDVYRIIQGPARRRGPAS